MDRVDARPTRRQTDAVNEFRVQRRAVVVPGVADRCAAQSITVPLTEVAWQMLRAWRTRLACWYVGRLAGSAAFRCPASNLDTR